MRSNIIKTSKASFTDQSRKIASGTVWRFFIMTGMEGRNPPVVDPPAARFVTYEREREGDLKLKLDINLKKKT